MGLGHLFMKEEFHILGAVEYPADAQIIKGKLESEGIPVFLLDENTLNSDPLISQAIGGVKIQVYTTDKERAITLYDEIRSYALDDEGNPIVNRKNQKCITNEKVYFINCFRFLKRGNTNVLVVI